MKLAVPLLALLLLGCQGGQYTFDDAPGSQRLLKDGNTVWELRYGPNVPKPFFHLGLTDGTVLTWDRPPDHVWHHAHWFTWKYINGLNYWEEDMETGQSEGVIEWRDVKVEKGGGGAAQISMRLDYHPPGEAELLREERVIAISAPAEDGSYSFDWSLRFTAVGGDVFLDRTPILGEEDGKPWGGYAGLSLRFARDLTAWQTVTTDGPVERDTSVNFHAEQGPLGLDFSGVIAGREAGIALLDHPRNLNAPTPWYIVMDQEKPFGFSEAALIYYKPVRLAAGEGFRLRYRVTVHEGRWDAERLRSAQAQFVKEVNER
jgi:methane monooxygenase PmoA-like